MSKTKLFAAALSASTLLAAGAALAQAAAVPQVASPPPGQTGVNQGAAKAAATPESSAVDQIATAAALADWARRNRDADAMVTAARMLRDVPATDGPVTGVLEGPVATGPAPARAAFSPTALFAEARTFARGNRGALQRIAAAEAAAPKGVINSAFGRGAIRVVRDVSANSTWTFTLNAVGGAPLRVSAIGDGDTDVDMIVRDGNGNVVCSDLDYSHRADCYVVPAWTGRFSVSVVNNGSVWTRTVVVSN